MVRILVIFGIIYVYMIVLTNLWLKRKSIQNQFNVILTQLISLTSTLSFHSEILSSTVAYPLPKFPTTAQEGLLTTLLRKKNLPEVDAWLSKAKEESEGLTLRYDDEICNWALTQTEKEREGREFFEFYTRKEVEDGTAEILEKQQQIREKEKGTGAGNNETNGDGFLINQMLGFMYNGEEPKTAQMAQ